MAPAPGAGGTPDRRASAAGTRRSTVCAALTAVMVAAACAGTTAARPAHSTAAVRPAGTAAAPRPQRRRQRGPRHAGVRVPILMYHAIGRPPDGAPYPLLYTRPRAFRAQLAALRRRGYRAVTLDRVWRAWHGHGRLPDRPVVVSFDDGFGGVARSALPTMRRMRWPGVLFLLLGHLDQPGRWDLSSAQVRRLIGAGWEVDPHGYGEVDLPAMATSAAWRVIHGSRAALRRRFHVPARFYCYPVGAYDRTVMRLVRRAGYRGAVTTGAGDARRGGDPFALPRVRVEGDETPAALLHAISAG